LPDVIQIFALPHFNQKARVVGKNPFSLLLTSSSGNESYQNEVQHF
jgi:hypothetical protein